MRLEDCIRAACTAAQLKLKKEGLSTDVIVDDEVKEMCVFDIESIRSAIGKVNFENWAKEMKHKNPDKSIYKYLNETKSANEDAAKHGIQTYKLAKGEKSVHNNNTVQLVYSVDLQSKNNLEFVENFLRDTSNIIDIGYDKEQGKLCRKISNLEGYCITTDDGEEKPLDLYVSEESIMALWEWYDSQSNTLIKELLYY